MVEIIAAARGSGTNVGEMSEQCRGFLPGEESNKSGAVMPMPSSFQRFGIYDVHHSLTSSTNTEYLKHRLVLLETETLQSPQDRLTEKGTPLGHDP